MSITTVNRGHHGNGSPDRPSRRGRQRRQQHAAIVSEMHRAAVIGAARAVDQACTHPAECVVTGEAGNRQCVECGVTL